MDDQHGASCTRHAYLNVLSLEVGLQLLIDLLVAGKLCTQSLLKTRTAPGTVVIAMHMKCERPVPGYTAYLSSSSTKSSRSRSSPRKVESSA